MRIFGGIIVGLCIWTFLFLALPQEFLGGAVGRPFDLDDGEITVRYPWGFVLMIICFFAIPYIVAKSFYENSPKK